MAISEKMRGMAIGVHEGVTNTSKSIFHILLRIITGFVLSLTFGLIGQVLIGYETFGLLFFMVVSMGLIYKGLSSWSLFQILIFDVICVLGGALLRAYILLAP